MSIPSPRVDEWLVNCLNILKLCSQGPKTWLQLWNSGCFIHPKRLDEGLNRLDKAGCLEFQDVGGIYLITITSMGVNLLKCYPHWKLVVVRQNIKNIDGYEIRKEVEETILQKKKVTTLYISSKGLKPWQLRLLKRKKE